MALRLLPAPSSCKVFLVCHTQSLFLLHLGVNYNCSCEIEGREGERGEKSGGVGVLVCFVICVFCVEVQTQNKQVVSFALAWQAPAFWLARLRYD